MRNIITVMIILENSPAGESESNGVAEQAVQEVQCQIRKMKEQLENQMGETITLESLVWPWLVEHAARTIYAYKECSIDKKTARERLGGNASTPPTAYFGESIHYKLATTNCVAKETQRWRKRIWLGFHDL